MRRPRDHVGRIAISGKWGAEAASGGGCSEGGPSEGVCFLLVSFFSPGYIVVGFIVGWVFLDFWCDDRVGELKSFYLLWQWVLPPPLSFVLFGFNAV